MEIHTVRFGDITVDEDKIFKFEDGLYGFEDKHRFAIVDTNSRSYLKHLQSLDDGALAFVVLDPRIIYPDYSPEINEFDMLSLGLDRLDDAYLLAIVVIPSEVSKMTANLQAPLVLNPKTLQGKQVITSNPEYKRRYPVFEGLKKAARLNA